MSAQDRMIVGATETARNAQAGARAHTQINSEAFPLRRGKIVSSLSGFYTVDVYSLSGTVVDTIEGVRAWGGTYAVGDRVMLLWESDRPIPYVIGSSGSGSGGSSEGAFVGICNRFFSS